MELKSFFKAGVGAAVGGLLGFLSGMTVQVFADIGGISAVSGVPVGAILPAFVMGGIGLGFASAWVEKK